VRRTLRKRMWHSALSASAMTSSTHQTRQALLARVSRTPTCRHLVQLLPQPRSRTWSQARGLSMSRCRGFLQETRSHGGGARLGQLQQGRHSLQLQLVLGAHCAGVGTAAELPGMCLCFPGMERLLYTGLRQRRLCQCLRRHQSQMQHIVVGGWLAGAWCSVANSNVVPKVLLRAGDCEQWNRIAAVWNGKLESHVMRWIHFVGSKPSWQHASMPSWAR